MRNKWGKMEKTTHGERKPGRAQSLELEFFPSFVLLIPSPQRGLDVTFLDVGQGDGICIQAGESVILIDGGSSSEKEVGKSVMEPFLKSRGSETLITPLSATEIRIISMGLFIFWKKKTGITIESLILPWLGQGGRRL